MTTITTTTEYDVRYRLEHASNVEGASYLTIDEAREAFEVECSKVDPSSYKTVELVEVECVYDDGECVEVHDVRVIAYARF